MLTYNLVTINKAGKSRFAVSTNIDSSQLNSNVWIKIQEVPKSIDISSLQLLNESRDLYRITKRAYREYDDIVTPVIPTRVSVTSKHSIETPNDNIIDNSTDASYDGLLVKKDNSTGIVSVITDTYGLIEITPPYVLQYTECDLDHCSPVYSRVNIKLVPINTNNNSKEIISIEKDRIIKLGFEADGLTWKAFYQCFFDFDLKLITSLTGDIEITNDMELGLTDVEASFTSTVNNYNEYSDNDSGGYRPRAMLASQSKLVSAPSSSPYDDNDSSQNFIGATTYSLKELIDIPEKSCSTVNLLRVKNLPMQSFLMLDLLSRVTRPKTLVTFKIPKEFINGVPGGKIEAWSTENNKKENGRDVWLGNMSMPVSGPEEEVILNLGENQLVECQVTIAYDNIETENIDNNSDKSKRNRTKYTVEAKIYNRSSRSIKIYPYQRLSNDNTDDISTLKGNYNGKVVNDKKAGLRLEFDLPNIMSGNFIILKYSITM